MLSFFIVSSQKYSVRSTNYGVSHYAVFSEITTYHCIQITNNFVFVSSVLHIFLITRSHAAARGKVPGVLTGESLTPVISERDTSTAVVTI
jgi:hypothetical protein